MAKKQKTDKAKISRALSKILAGKIIEIKKDKVVIKTKEGKREEFFVKNGISDALYSVLIDVKSSLIPIVAYLDDEDPVFN